MKRMMGMLTMTTLLLLGAILSSARSGDFELAARHVKTIEVKSVEARNGKNTALTIEVKAPAGVKLPRGITALVNDRQVHLYDDGRWPDERTGDGIYTVAGASKSAEPIGRSTLRLQSIGAFEHHAMLPKVSCTLERVECPANCTSFLFHSKCVVCFSLKECSIEF